MSRRPESGPSAAAHAAVERGIKPESPSVVGGTTNVDAPVLGDHRKRRTTRRHVGQVIATAALPTIAAGALGVSALRDAGSSTVETASASITSVDASHTQSIIPAREAAAPVVDAAGIPTNLGFELTAAHVAAPATPATGEETHTETFKPKSGDTLGKKVERDLKEAGIAKPTEPQKEVGIVLNKVAAGLPDADEVNAGHSYRVVDKESLKRVAEAVTGDDQDAKFDKDVADLAAGIKSNGYDSKVAAGRATHVLEALGVDLSHTEVQDADGKDDPKAKAFDGVKPLEPQLSSDDLKTAIGTAEEAGTVVEKKLTEPNIWTEEQQDGDLNNAGTNPVARSAVVLSKNNPDEKMSKKGKFNERKMHENDPYAAIAPELVPLVAGVASMSQEQMEQLQDKLPADVFQQILTIWEVNHDQTDIAKRDQAMVEAFLTLTKGLDMETLKTDHPELFAFLGELGKKDNAKELAGAIAGLTADQLRQFFPTQETDDPQFSTTVEEVPEKAGENGATENKFVVKTEGEIRADDPNALAANPKEYIPSLTDEAAQAVPKLEMYKSAADVLVKETDEELQQRVINFRDFMSGIVGDKLTEEQLNNLADKYYEFLLKELTGSEKLIPDIVATAPAGPGSTGTPSPTPSTEAPSPTPSTEGTQETPSNEPGAISRFVDSTGNFLQNKWQWLAGAGAIGVGGLLVGLGTRGVRRRRKATNEAIKSARNTDESKVEPTAEYPIYSNIIGGHVRFVAGSSQKTSGTPPREVQSDINFPPASSPVWEKFWEDARKTEKELLRTVDYIFNAAQAKNWKDKVLATLKARPPLRKTKRDMLMNQLEALGIVGFDTEGNANIVPGKNRTSCKKIITNAFHPGQSIPPSTP